MIGKEQIDTLVFPNLNYYSSMWMSWNFLVIFSQILFFMGRECYLRVSLPSPTLLCLLFILTAGKQNCTWCKGEKKKKTICCTGEKKKKTICCTVPKGEKANICRVILKPFEGHISTLWNRSLFGLCTQIYSFPLSWSRILRGQGISFRGNQMRLYFQIIINVFYLKGKLFKILLQPTIGL